jgi:intraflagellar transport protein 80
MQDAGSWALLAGLAVAAQQLSTAEAAYAAIEAVDKLQFVLHCKGLLGEERAAELALFRRQPDEAEALLLQVGALAAVHPPCPLQLAHCDAAPARS